MPTLKTTNLTTNTVNGEVTINLNLTVTIDGEGKINITQEKQKNIESDKINFEIPDFDIDSQIDFGK